MNATEFSKFKLICSKVRDSIPSSYTASWDEDFQVIRIVFEKTEKKPLLQTLIQEFQFQWDFTSIDNASDFIEKFITSIFGIIPGQILFTSNETSIPILFAVWWPWGNEDYISLRLGIYSPEDPSGSRSEIKQQLTGWFDL